MANVLLTSFNNGVASPYLDARSDIEKYTSSCRTMDNMLPLVYGGAMRRPGTEYIGSAKGATSAVRLIPFIYSATVAYMCEFGDLYIRFYYDGAPVLAAGNPEEVTSPYAAHELPALQYYQLGDTMWLVHPNHAPRKLTRTSVTEFSLDAITFTQGPFRTRNDIENDNDVTMQSDVIALDGTGTLTASAATFEAGHVGSIWKVVQTKATMSLSYDTYISTTPSSAIDVKGPWSFLGTATSAGEITLQRNLAGAGWDTHRVLSMTAGTTTTISGTEEDTNVQYRFILDSSAGTMQGDLTLSDPLQKGVVRVDSFTSSTAVGITVLAPLVVADTTEVRWAEGSWSAVNGYPTAVAFFENRIVYGGTDADPQSVWLSETGDYENFDEDVKDADSFSLTLTTTDRIRWLAALDVLAVGTSGDEWRVGSTRLEETLTPTAFNARQQTTYGCKSLQALKVNGSVLFVDYVGRKIREFTFNADQQRYVAPNLVELAEHITESGIVGLAYQKSPGTIIWCVLDDGSLVSMTYERDQNVVAWAAHPMQTGALVESVAVIPGTDEDEVWVLVRRTIGGSTVRYIERMQPWDFGDQEDAFFVDCGLSYDSVPATTFSGLDHLEGETVSILGDGAVFPDAVVASGSITLTTSVSKAVVGLPYRYTLQPMRINISGPTGSSHGSRMKIAELVISFLETGGAWYGDSVDTLYPIAWRDDEAYGTPPALFTGDKVVVLDGGFDAETPFMISGNEPLPCTVRAIVARVDKVGR